MPADSALNHVALKQSTITVRPAKAVRGVIRIPGDKSI